MSNSNTSDFNEYGPFNSIFRLDQYNWSKIFYPIMPDGVLAGVDDEMKVYANSTGLIVYIKTGEAHVRGHRAKLTTATSLTINAANASLPRFDRIVARCVYGEGSTSKITLGVIEGDPGASLAKPVLTQIEGNTWEIPLALVLVPAAAVTIAAGNVYDERVLLSSSGDFNIMDIFYYGG